jgi:cyclic beta-1,2-glucan synthetase
MQRAGVESILGLRVEGDSLVLDPCIPGSWPSFEITLRRGGSRYEITVENPQGVQRGVADAALDGVAITTRPVRVAFKDDRRVHRLWVRLG